MAKSKRPLKDDKIIRGGVLRLAASIGDDYARAQTRVMRLMHKDVMAAVAALNRAYAQDSIEAFDLPEGGALPAQARIILNRLLRKYDPIFGGIAKKATESMLRRVSDNSAATLRMSLREMAEQLSIDTDYTSPEMREILAASAEEAASKIKTIPQEYLSSVQSIVMRSISSGNGVLDLVKSLNSQFYQSQKKATSEALNQTRRAYQNINAARCKSYGMKEFEWIHSGGGKHPRKDHIAMNGNIYRYDDPPVIGIMYGEEVRGLPGGVPNCGCTTRPIINFSTLIDKDQK